MFSPSPPLSVSPSSASASPSGVSPRLGRPPLAPALLAARRARLIAELTRPTPDFDAAAADLGLTRGTILRVVRELAPGAVPRGRPRLTPVATLTRFTPGQRAARLARLRAELLKPAPNLKAAAYELGITLGFAGLMVRRDLGYRTFYVSAAERDLLIAARRAEFLAA